MPLRPETDQAQLRATAHRLGPRFWEVVRLDPRADVPRYDPITGYRTWAEVETDPPQPTGLVTWLTRLEAIVPTRPPSRCAEPGCRELTTEGRCDEHKRKPWSGRDDKAARYDGISSGEWRRLKARVSRRDNGCCYMCGAEPDLDDTDAEAFVLDHKTPVSEGGSARDLDNLGLLCPPCDTVKSAAEAERGRLRHLARRRGITPL